jgi:hypothetical protein
LIKKKVKRGKLGVYLMARGRVMPGGSSRMRRVGKDSRRRSTRFRSGDKNEKLWRAFWWEIRQMKNWR